jgi:pyruvate dehydrogenase E1 component beta subunit
VLAPATIEDAFGMLGAALADPDPVVIFEHVQLYNLEADLPDERITDISSARVRREGKRRRADHLRRLAAQDLAGRRDARQ